MSRLPSGLLYLAIYNPTLQPKHPAEDDDEDAEEQAHILFYTSKERAVSRDRMLRQIGLAKALVNFSELFNPNDECESVHSQSRRMILVSPEPGFWFNATVELPKKVQAPTSKPSNKGKPKTPAPKASAETAYDYDDGTVHDIATRSQILRAYERFKLSHGSFASILLELGQEALELQLERFFTPWAWSWNLEDKPHIVEQLGVPLQPYYTSLTPLLDTFSVNIPESVAPVALSPTHIIPSTRYTSNAYPSALAELLMTMIPPPTSPADVPLTSSVDTIREPIHSPEPNKPKSDSSSPWLPAVNVNMDMRTWNWQSYLTFGKSRNQSPEKSSPPLSQDAPREESQSDDSRQEVHIDAKSLREALASEGLSVGAPDGNEGENRDGAEPRSDPDIGSEEEKGEAGENALQLEWGTSTQESPMSSMTILPRPRAPSPPPPSFLCRRVYLAPPEDPISTKKCDVHFYVRDGMVLALISDPSLPGFTDVEEFLSVAAQHANDLLEEVQLTIQNAALARMSESLPTASKILQSPDQHAISTEQYVLQSPGFASDSGHLHNAISLFERDRDVLEVYSRGQNPQSWHIAKRGLAATSDFEDDATLQSTQRLRGKAFLEIFKKEASLPDVDNVLAGVLRRSGVAESGLV